MVKRSPLTNLGVVFFFLLSCFSLACKKDELVQPTAQVDQIDLASLKKYYQAKSDKSSPVNWMATLKPIWAKTKVIRNAQELVVEVEVTNPDHIFISAKDVVAKDAGKLEAKGAMKMVFITNLLTKKINACLMMITADDDFDLNKQALEQLHYKDMAQFSGVVNFYELNGSYANGWAYKNGKIIAKLTKKVSIDNLSRTKGATVMNAPGVIIAKLNKKASIDNLSRTKGATVMNAPAVPCGTYRQLHWRQECITAGPPGEEYQNCTWAAYYTTETLYCPVNDEGGGDNGGGGYEPGEDPEPTAPNPTDSVVVDTTKNPCKLAEALAKHEGFKFLLDSLKQKVTGNVEYAYRYKFNADGSFNDVVSAKGAPNEAGVKIHYDNGEKIDGMIHNHYTGLYSIFSPGDLQLMATAYLDGNMVNPKTFTLGVVTASGTQYLLKIDDVVKFKIFAQNITNTSFAQNFSNLWYKTYKLKETNSAADNESGFLGFLENLTSGLKVFKGDSNFNQWTPKKIANGEVVNDPCLPVITNID